MKKIYMKISFYLTGLGALAWFLIRVIPKPSRAAYPCQRAAFPIASAFVLYLIALVASAFALNKLKNGWRQNNSFAAVLSLLLLLISGSFLLQSDKPFSYAGYLNIVEDPNQPIGSGAGVFPGRVVWIHDPSAVDQQCSNSAGDYWWMDSNTNQTVVNKMVSDAIQSLTGTDTDSEAWDAIFRYYNKTHGKGDVGYSAGEKIVIKLNLNTGTTGTSYTRSDNRTIDTSPQVVCAVIDQLVNNAGVTQQDIGFGDPGRNVDNIFWDKFHSQFPDVKYWGNGSGRTPITESESKVFFTSDGKLNHYIPKCYVDAAYMINIPVFKQHHRAGISLGAKNHIGTFVPFTPDWAVRDSLHKSFPSSQGNGTVDNGNYHLYRLFVDFMGHKDLGGKTILYLVDGLWSSTNYGDPPYKWSMAPFNGQYPASIFASQDPVAIESVGFDFLYNEFYPGNPSGNAFPRYAGVDDFLHQAADSINWPEDILYDPEGDGSYLLRSMGVHEHWNNPDEKKYSRNLGLSEGIELVGADGVPVPVELTSFKAEINGNKIKLSWSTATEKNNAGFEIQSSRDNKDFVKAGFVEGKGTTSEPQFYSYSDDVSENKIYYRLKQIDYNGTYKYSDVIEVSSLPGTFRLFQNFPNPFNPGTTIRFSVAKSSDMTLIIYDISGKEIRSLINGSRKAGTFEVQWDGKDNSGYSVPSGVYFYRIEAGHFSQSKKMILMK